MRAMILAAGYGTRLWPLTIDRTKPAIPFMGRPLIGYVAEYLAGYGFDNIVVNLHHQPESVRAALGDGGAFGVRFHYVEEPVILGTSGAIGNARDRKRTRLNSSHANTSYAVFCRQKKTLNIYSRLAAHINTTKTETPTSPAP